MPVSPGESNLKNGLKLALVTLLLGAAAFLIFRFVNTPKEGDLVMDEMSVWQCSNSSCNEVFKMKRKDLLAVQRETGSAIPKCPKCGKLGTEVYECPFCNQVFEPIGHGSYPDNCPHCGKNLAGDSSKDLATPKKPTLPAGHGG